mmetsp:Transcript_6501/g.5843  ORF Transcript_6501/g.5843 Transcript_6501/m.5843 type:complete len:150 (-) Transcript_6501:67-516(-)
MNLLVVCLLFFLLFGIFGVNFFKGNLYYCDFTNVPQVYHSMVQNKVDCLDYGGNWLNRDASFDNVFTSTSLLFQVATTEGWIDIMLHVVDATGIDSAPKIDHRRIWGLFFVIFIIVASFFLLNLFAGVVVDTFNRERDRIGGLSFLKKE